MIRKPARAYRIETERLVIRCYEPKDAFVLADAIASSMPELLPWIPWAKEGPETEEDKIARIRWMRGKFDMDEDYTFGMFDRQEKTFIGSTGFHRRVGNNASEIGYWINTAFAGKGYASEAVKALVKTGFEIECLERLEIHVDPRNHKSVQIPGKLGFFHEATLQKRYQRGNDPLQDTMIWTMFREDYEKSDLRFIPIEVFDFLGRKIELTN